MRILSLEVENIGPFDRAKLDFIPADATDAGAPVALITGENGMGKSIIVDAIRQMFNGPYCTIERRISRDQTWGSTVVTLDAGIPDRGLTRHEIRTNFDPSGDSPGDIHPVLAELRALPNSLRANPTYCPRWVVDFWRSNIAIDSYELKSLSRAQHDLFLKGALSGRYRNATVSELLCNLDYMRDSRDPKEQRAGAVIYALAEKIVRLCLLDGGELAHIERSRLRPIVRQAGHLVPLANISSGNAYLVHHLIGLLGKMYAVQQLLGLDPEELTKTPGLLLIEEPENHLHPKWQKKVLPSILEVFPNLQIIATTHSPFVLSSIPHARVFACRFDGNACVVDDVTTDYVDQPAEEILLSEAFDTTTPFGLHMTELLQKRKAAIAAGDSKARADAEAELKRRNPRHFAYLDIDAKLEALTAKKSA